MLRILLADDEPIALSGVRHLINWEKNGCTVVAAAASGTEALRLLETEKPDIVVCDIAMPDVSGIEVLKKANEAFPEMVFIMLATHQEFDLARESLRNRAVEYLIKNRLGPAEMERALIRAVAEWETRNALRRLTQAGGNSGFSGRIERAVLELADTAAPVFSPENAALLQQAEMLSGFALAFISPQSGTETAPELYNWEIEIIRRLGASFFPKHLVLSPPGGGADRLILVFIWNLPREGWEIRAEMFKEQLKKTSAQIAGLDVGVIFSQRAEHRRDIDAWRNGLPSLPPRRSDKKPDTAAGHAEIIARAKQYILDNLERPIALRDLADHAAISPGYLSTIFKKELHQNLMGYINMIKTERACALLKQGKYRIYEISYMLGFENAYYFTRVFRRYAGVSPSEYQKKICPQLIPKTADAPQTPPAPNDELREPPAPAPFPQ